MIPLIPEVSEFRYIIDPEGFARVYILQIKQILLRNENFVMLTADHKQILGIFKSMAAKASFLQMPSAKRVIVWTALNISQTRNWVHVADWFHQLTSLDLFQTPRRRRSSRATKHDHAKRTRR